MVSDEFSTSVVPREYSDVGWAQAGYSTRVYARLLRMHDMVYGWELTYYCGIQKRWRVESTILYSINMSWGGPRWWQGDELLQWVQWVQWAWLILSVPISNPGPCTTLHFTFSTTTRLTLTDCGQLTAIPHLWPIARLWTCESHLFEAD